jgi:hypothetical protein
MRSTIVALLLIALGRSLHSQEIRGTVRDSATNQPVPAAVLTLLGTSGAPLGRNITNDRGEFRIALTPGMERVRVVRIGFRPSEVQIPKAANGVVVIDILMRSLPTMLEPVRVSAGATCPRRSDDARTYALLEQVRAGLLSIVVAREANPAALVLLAFEQTMDGSSDRAMSQSVRIDSARRAKTSFNAAHAATDFVKRGFMADSAQHAVFFAPDADVLLDDGFAAGYCFRVVESGRNRPNQIGLAFAAANRRAGRVDIDGTLWVDTVGRALRDIEFRYVGLGRQIETLRPGGHIAFREMPNGMVLIDRWALRLIATEIDTVRVDTREQIRTWYRAAENGGELARAKWPDGSVWRASLGSLRVQARTADGRPAPRASVHLPGTHYRATADSQGAIEISDLVPGPYTLAIADVRLEPIGIEIPSPLKFVAARDSIVQATIVARTANDFTIDRCVADRRYTPGDSVLLLGRVLGGDGQPVAGVAISLAETSPPPASERMLPDGYTTGDDGLFQFCSRSLRRGMSLTIRARRGGSILRVVTVQLDDNLTVLRLPVDIRP